MDIKKLDPKNANHAVLGKILSQMQVVKGDKGEQGEPGKTPKKGEDYFTDSEIAAIIKYVQQNLTKGDKGDSGDKGEKGNDGYDGADGKTPVKGVDYFTKSEQAELITTVLRSIKVPKDGVSPKAEDVAKIILSSTPKKSAEDEFVTIKQLVDFLKRGGFRGGGGSSTGSSISLTTTGTSGAATLVGDVLNVPNYTPGGTVISVSGTANRVTSTGGTTPILDISATFEALLEKVANKSTTTSLGTSDTLYPTQNAVKTYVDGIVAGLLDYRGAYDASVNTFPATGGSGTAGAVMKGDMWILSVAGTLGGTAVQVGDSLIASIDTPGQTASNWNILNANISYVPEDVANKATTMSGNTASDTKYLSAKAVYDWGIATFAALAGSVSQVFAVSQLELGHATDTTLSRVSAGVVAVEGQQIATTAKTTETTNTATVVAIGGTSHIHTITALASANTFGVPTIAIGALDDRHKLMIRILDNGTARALTWNIIFKPRGAALPTTTTLSKYLYVGFEYNAVAVSWDCIAVSTEA